MLPAKPDHTFDVLQLNATVIAGPWKPKPSLHELLLAIRFLQLCKEALSSEMTDEQILTRFKHAGVDERMLKAVWTVLNRWNAAP